MKRRIFHLPAFAALISLAALPAVSAPKVATDIPPVQSLAARVMQGVGKPESILPPGATPHSYSMRPSEAAKLADADIVFWVGEGLAPWFGYAILGLAADAVSVELMKAPGVALLDFREDQHGDHDHDHGHTHPGEKDPHIWLDPANGKAMLAEMAVRLAKLDPANAEAYAANAAAGAAELDVLAERVEAIVAPVRGKAFVTAHDGYTYFERRFGIESEGSVALSDAASPGPARLDRIRHAIQDHGVACVFIEPQLDPKLAQTAAEGTNARIAVLDPLGAELEPGPGLYPALIEGLARSLADCLAGAQ